MDTEAVMPEIEVKLCLCSNWKLLITLH